MDEVKGNGKREMDRKVRKIKERDKSLNPTGLLPQILPRSNQCIVQQGGPKNGPFKEFITL